MSREPVGFALIGCGGIASVLADAIAEVEDATLSACADLVAENARGVAEEYGVAAWYTDHETMLAEIDPDVAVVATPNGTHADIAVDCARAGVDVLCQKPLDLTVERIDRMVEACEDHDVSLGGLYNLRFDRGSHATKRAVETGALGDVVVANGTCPVYRDEEYYTGWHGTADLDGGCLFTQGIHVVDGLAWCNGGIERVFADLDTVAHDVETEDVAAVQVRYGNGARGTITATTATREYPHYDRMDVHGEEGYVVSTSGEVLSSGATGGEPLDAEYPHDRTGFAFQVADMAEAVREGRDPVVAGREARHAPDAILAMHESARRDEPVVVEEFLDRSRAERVE
jgi:predicted dehydrogenase